MKSFGGDNEDKHLLSPSVHDILHLNEPESAPNYEAGLAENVSSVIVTISCHMKYLHGQLPSSVGHHEDGISSLDLLEAWLKILVYSSQLVCWSLLDIYRNMNIPNEADSAEALESATCFTYYIHMLRVSRECLFVHLDASNNTERANMQDKSLKTRYE